MALFKKPTAEEVDVLGKPLSCVVCQHDRFLKREAQLTRPVAAFFYLYSAKENATCAICDRCGYVHWFL